MPLISTMHGQPFLIPLILKSKNASINTSKCRHYSIYHETEGKMAGWGVMSNVAFFFITTEFHKITFDSLWFTFHSFYVELKMFQFNRYKQLFTSFLFYTISLPASSQDIWNKIPDTILEMRFWNWLHKALVSKETAFHTKRQPTHWGHIGQRGHGPCIMILSCNCDVCHKQ